MKKIFLVTIITILNISTFSQPVDFDLGAKHNQVVGYLDNYDFTGKTEELFMDDVFEYAAKLYEPNGFAENKGGGIWGQIWFCAKGQGGGERLSYEGVINSLQQNGKISTASNIFLNTLISETETLPDYNSFLNKVTSLEKEYNTSSLPEEEQVIIQGALSVFKQSALMWNNYYSSDEVTPDTQGRRFNLRCFFCVVKNDLKGALLGFIIGNCVCKKLGLPKPLVCGAIGATVFGASYSWAAKVCPEVCTRCRKPSPSSYPSWICQLPFLYWP